MRIAHIADVHIRGLQYMDEIEYTFEKLYESLRKEKPNLIVICGDLYHSKLTVTSEYFITCRKFLINLIRIAKTIIIPGNHDVALNNLDRVDAITPVVEAVNNKDLIYSKHSGLISNFDDKFCFWHFSCLDKKEKWPTKKILNKDLINIALYHGSINNCIVDNGWVSRGNKDDITLFDGFDFAFLGDIHKHQFMSPRIAYPGSLRQNNYGEDLEKGYILWNIENKNDFKAEFIILPQKRYFFTIHANSINSIPSDLNLPKDSRIQVKLTKPITLSEEIKIKNLVKKLYKPRNDVPIIPPEYFESIGKLTFGDKIEIDNVRNPELQKRLIKEFFKKDKNISKKDLEKIVELDSVYHSYINTDVLRNIKWKIEQLEWNNLFSYGEGNKIDFRKLSGLIGIFGKNGIGKSSIIDIFLYIVQNSINREGAIKNIEYVNNKKTKAFGKCLLSIDDKIYVIERSTEKKKIKDYSERVVNEVNFKKIYNDKREKFLSLCGETQPITNKNIRNYFGTLEDFNTISLISQFGGTSNAGLTSFIDARGTKRKEILVRFQDLGIFDEKYKIANEDFKLLKDKLSKHEEQNYLQLIEEKQNKKDEVEKSIQETQKYLEIRKNNLDLINQQIFELSTKIQNDIYDEKRLNKLIKEKDSLILLEKKQSNFIENLTFQIRNLQFKIKENNLEKNNLRHEIKDLQQHEKNREIQQNKIINLKKKIFLLETIPNVEACRQCSLAADAYCAKEELIDESKKLLENRNSVLKEKEEQLYVLLEIEAKQNRVDLAKNNLLQIKQKLQNINEQILEIKKFKETIKVKKEIELLQNQKEIIKKDIEKYERILGSLYKEDGSLEESVKNLKEKQKEAEELQYKFYIMQLYLKAMGKDGIAYMIMSQRLPLINKEVNHILSQITDFRIIIEDDQEEKSIKIFMIDKNGKRPIELTSGAEKTLAAIAFRAALWNISSLPKSSLLILDEPFGFLENEKYDSILNLLSYLKNYFKHIILISHNEDIKVAMDHVIYIGEDEEGLAHVEV